MRHSLILGLAVLVLLTGCKERASQNQYLEREVGVSRAVELATVMSVREVPIAAKSTGTGMLIGAGAGAGGGSYVGGGGKPWAVAGGALLGAVTGYMAEQELNDRTGYEYVLRMDDDTLKTITQEKVEGDLVFKKGDRVMLQACDAGDNYRRCAAGSDYQRLLPTDIPKPAAVPVASVKRKPRTAPVAVPDDDAAANGDVR